MFFSCQPFRSHKTVIPVYQALIFLFVCFVFLILCFALLFAWSSNVNRLCVYLLSTALRNPAPIKFSFIVFSIMLQAKIRTSFKPYIQCVLHVSFALILL